jgi:hypothetical protein
MSRPKKNQGWSQGLYAVSSTKRESLGALRETEDGRKFRYAKAGATLVPGGSTQAAAGDANHIAEIQTSGAVNAVGSTRVAMYISGTAVTANQFDDGYLIINRTAGVKTPGYIYPISSHSVSAAGSEIIYLTLKEPLQEATLLTCYFSIFCNPWSAVIVGTNIAVFPTGQSMANATSGQYLWLQTGGIAAMKGGDTSAVGMQMTTGTSDHTLLTAAAQTSPSVGAIYSIAAESGYFGPIFMMLD